MYVAVNVKLITEACELRSELKSKKKTFAALDNFTVSLHRGAKVTTSEICRAYVREW